MKKQKARSDSQVIMVPELRTVPAAVTRATSAVACVSLNSHLVLAFLLSFLLLCVRTGAGEWLHSGPHLSVTNDPSLQCLFVSLSGLAEPTEHYWDPRKDAPLFQV